MLKFTKDHEWLRVDGDVGVVGITPFAQEQLGDLVFVELPSVGATFEKGAVAATVESVKAASDVYAPVGGRNHRGERQARRGARPRECATDRQWLAVQDQDRRSRRDRGPARRSGLRAIDGVGRRSLICKARRATARPGRKHFDDFVFQEFGRAGGQPSSGRQLFSCQCRHRRGDHRSAGRDCGHRSPCRQAFDQGHHLPRRLQGASSVSDSQPRSLGPARKKRRPAGHTPLPTTRDTSSREGLPSSFRSGSGTAPPADRM